MELFTYSEAQGEMRGKYKVLERKTKTKKASQEGKDTVLEK